MRTIVVTKTMVWEESIPDVGVEVEEVVEMLLAECPDSESLEVEER